jgi:hypothetical protein
MRTWKITLKTGTKYNGGKVGTVRAETEEMALKKGAVLAQKYWPGIGPCLLRAEPKQ